MDFCIEGDVVNSAVRRCPFLGQLAKGHSQEFAREVAQSSGRQKGPILCESLTDYHSTFKLFHGANGVVPLVESKQCPFKHSQAETAPILEKGHSSQVATHHEGAGHEGVVSSIYAPKQCPMPMQRCSAAASIQAAPFASMSTSIFKFLPSPEEFIRQRRKRKQHRKQRDLEQAKQDRAKQHQQSSQSQGKSGVEKWRTHPIVGGLIPLNAAGKYCCPPLVVAGRAAVAQLKTTRFLRPQQLPVKLLGVGGHCLAANVPCGILREHTEKFSPAWILVVHATVPYFGFLRKGVGMPKWAILLTIATAITGQAIGARLERKRLHWLQDQSQHSSRHLHTASRLPHETKCPLLKTCKEVSQCEELQSGPVPSNNMILSN